MIQKHKQHINSGIGVSNHEFYQIPVIGEVHLHEDESENAANFSLGKQIQNFRKQDRQTITVRALDDALAGEGIIKNDLLTVNLKEHPRNGDIAAVTFGPKLFIRKIFFQKEFIRLDTSDEAQSPLIIDAHTPDFLILGKITMVVREL